MPLLASAPSNLPPAGKVMALLGSSLILMVIFFCFKSLLLYDFKVSFNPFISIEKLDTSFLQLSYNFFICSSCPSRQNHGLPIFIINSLSSVYFLRFALG